MTTTVSAPTAADGTEGEPDEELIRAEIPGTVLEVTVAVGTWVPADGVVAVLESMKMEIPVLAEYPGTVTRVAVAEGRTVRGGDVVAACRPSPAGDEARS